MSLFYPPLDDASMLNGPMAKSDRESENEVRSSVLWVFASHGRAYSPRHESQSIEGDHSL
jgi:hypothetical protein